MTHSPDFELYADQKTFNESVPPTWQAALEGSLAAKGKNESSIRFLDVGCGDGKVFNFLRNQGLPLENIDGVEVSHKRVERCHAMGWTAVKYMEPGGKLPYPDASFDVINLMEVVEHVPADTIDSLLGEVARALAPEGAVFVTTPNYPIKRFYDFYNVAAHRKWKRLQDDPTHVSHYNHKRLAAVLGRHFRVLEEHSFKDGFLYKRFRHPFFRHKIFFRCSNPR